MKGYLVLLALLGLANAAPQNWPYRDSLMPNHRYGYPSESYLKYLPQIEDDEDIGPYPARFRQEGIVVGSDGQSAHYVFRRPISENKAWSPNWKIGDRARPTSQTVVTGVVETGSVAPVVDATDAPIPTPTTPASPPPKRVAPTRNTGKPVQPPPFPPARPPPPTRPQKEEESEEEEDEDEDEDEGDSDEDNEDEDDDDDDDDDDDYYDDDDEYDYEDRRRQVPLNVGKVDEKSPAKKDSESGKAPPAEAPAPVVVDPAVSPNKSVEPESSSVEEVNAPVEPESNEVDKPVETVEDEDEDEFEDGIEALVPGYVTDQGEVLVPVDTVTGDQPISIVPDPYSPMSHGVPFHQSPNYRYTGYNPNPYLYHHMFDDDLERQVSDESSEEDSKESDDETQSDGSEERFGRPEGRNEFLTAFPPSRTPELYAVINSRYPLESDEVGGYVPPRRTQQNVALRVKPSQERPSVSVAVAVSGERLSPNQQYIRNPYVNHVLRNPYVSQVVRIPSENPYANLPYVNQHRRNPYVGPYVRNPYVGQYVRNPYVGDYVRNPYIGQHVRNPYLGQYVQNPYVGQHVRSPYGGSNRPSVFINKFINRQPLNKYAGPYSPMQYGPSPFYEARPIRRPPFYQPSPFVGYGPRRPPRPQGNPFFVKKRPGYKPTRLSANLNKHKPTKGTSSKVKPQKVSHTKPTPVDYQDDFPYGYDNPQNNEPGWYEISNKSQSDEKQDTSPAEKNRRGAKMAKKVGKKARTHEKKKVVDPLRILNKINSKRG